MADKEFNLQDIIDLDVNASLALLLNASGPLFKANVEKWAAVNQDAQRQTSYNPF